MIYTYKCPVCRKKVRMDNPGEPVCTGPSETRHDHVWTLMRLVKHSVHGEVNPDFAERRANLPLIMLPDHADFAHWKHKPGTLVPSSRVRLPAY